MYDLSVKAEHLGKMYRLYRHPRDKILDAFGLNFWRKEYFQEFWAIRNLHLEIKKGERLGIIGRNGAGKSTLLKIIIGNVSPTEGTIAVTGRIQALMELGTGFHPEFTGRQNITAALSYQGFSQQQIAEKEEEIIDFAELDEFIDQPLKTYSAGMYARLAFSTATTVEPDVLIIDEVLGAGDAYFAGKCFDRMKRLTQDSGATVLFVSHDMSSVEMLCNRCLWIERGSKKMEGPVLDVTKAYAQEVRERTSQRVKAKNALMSAQASWSMRKLRDTPFQLIVCFSRMDGPPLEVSTVSLHADDLEPVEVRVGEPQDNSYQYDGFVLIDGSISTWERPSEDRDGTHFRALAGEGDRRSAVVFNIDGLPVSSSVRLRVRYRGSSGSTARLEIYDGRTFHLLAEIGCAEKVAETDRSWREWRGTVGVEIIEQIMEVSGFSKAASESKVVRPILESEDAPQSEDAPDVEHSLSVIESQPLLGEPTEAFDSYQKGEIFQGKVAIERVLFATGDGKESPIVKSFDDLHIQIDYRVLEGPVAMEFVVCLHRLGIIAFQALSGLQSDGLIDGQEGSVGRCTLEIPRLPLGKGSYFVSVAIFPPLQYQSLDTEKLAYVLHDRRYELHVEQPEDLAIDLGMCRGQVQWRFDPR